MAVSPIKSVTPINSAGTATGAAVTTLPAPTTYKWSLSDISGSNAGRVASLKMVKMRKGQSRTIELEWKPVSLADCASILAAYNSEYIRVEFMDAKAGTWATKDFYVGDRNSPLIDHNTPIGMWESVGFTIIQRDADK